MRNRDFLGLSRQELGSALGERLPVGSLRRCQFAERDEFHPFWNGIGLGCCDYSASAPLTLFRTRSFFLALHTGQNTISCLPWSTRLKEAACYPITSCSHRFGAGTAPLRQNGARLV